MKFTVELEIESEKVPLWSYSQGIMGYAKRDRNECIEYLEYILMGSGIKILNMK